LFGPTNPDIFGHPVNRNIRCAFCGPRYNTGEFDCQKRACLSRLAPEIVVEAVDSVLGTSTGAGVPKPAIPRFAMAGAADRQSPSSAGALTSDGGAAR